MAIQPEDFLQAAEMISQRQPVAGEARHRTVVGRAYYAAYLVVREAVRREFGLSTEFEPGHESLANTLAAQGGTKDVQKIGHKLNTLRQYRLTSDYFPKREITEDQADIALEESSWVIAAVSQAPGNFPVFSEIPK